MIFAGTGGMNAADPGVTERVTQKTHGRDENLVQAISGKGISENRATNWDDGSSQGLAMTANGSGDETGAAGIQKTSTTGRTTRSNNV